VAIAISIYSLPTFAQVDSVQLKQNILTAFENYETKDSITMDSHLGEELKNSYYLGYKYLDIKDFTDENKANKLIQFYSTTEGIESIFRNWMIQSDTLDFIFPIDRFLHLNILLGSQKSEDETNTDVKTEPNSQVNNTTVEPTQNETPKHEMSRGSKRYNQHVERSETSGISRHGIAEVKPNENKTEIESQVTYKPKFTEQAVEMDPKIMLPTRTFEFERQRIMAISNLQHPVIPIINPNSQKQAEMLTCNTPNKYAILIINEPDKPEAEMYLDGKFIKELKLIKNGVRVWSNHRYEYEIKLENTVYCKDTITLVPRDKKTVKCNKLD
jgi:hypothetical protein